MFENSLVLDNLSKLKRKKCLVSRNLTDRTFFGCRLLIHFCPETSENFSIFSYFFNDFYAFPRDKKRKKKFTYLLTLKEIEMFPETRHLFFWPKAK